MNFLRWLNIKKMKAMIKRKLIVFIIIVATGLIYSSSCNEICNGMGTLKLTNKSVGTVQKILIDGVNYGTIDPGESKEIDLAPGEHDFQQVGVSGGTGCGVASVIIIECKTSAFECKY